MILCDEMFGSEEVLKSLMLDLVCCFTKKVMKYLWFHPPLATVCSFYKLADRAVASSLLTVFETVS